MNLRQNFKQSWQIVKQNKLFSGIYILGTAITISMVMTIAIVWIAKTADMYPEVDRSRMMSIKGLSAEFLEDGFVGGSNLSHRFVEEIVRSTKTLECATAVCPVIMPLSLRTTGEGSYNVYPYFADQYFWTVFSFKFLSGEPFSEEDVSSQIHKAVISESLAKKCFDGVEAAVGKHFTVEFIEFTVCGVVKDVSYIMNSSYADIWLPISTMPDYDAYDDSMFGGPSSLFILAHSSKDFSKIRSEVDEQVAAYNNSQDEMKLSLLGQPDSFSKSLLREYSDEAPDVDSYILRLLLVILLILLVPAINLAGMISSRMSRRGEEIGIRKAFGAPKKNILWQVVNENLLLTLIGGAVGILLSYLVLILGGNMIIQLIIPDPVGLVTDVDYTLSMLVNPWIFLLVIVVCLILNLIAAIIPAVISLSRNIVDSINMNSAVTRQIWSHKRSNAWIFVEMIIVFVVAWFVIEPIYVIEYQRKGIKDGFDSENLFSAKINAYPKESIKSDKERYTQKTVMEDLDRMINFVRSFPEVESTTIVDGYTPWGGQSSQYSVKDPSDTSAYVTIQNYNFLLGSDYFDVFRLQSALDHKWESIAELDIPSNGVIITEDTRIKLFPDSPAIGHTLTIGKDNYVVSGVTEMIKGNPSSQPICSVFFPETQLKMRYVVNNDVSIAIRLKPGTSGKRFVEKFSEEVVSTFWLKIETRRGEIGLRMAMGSTRKKIRNRFIRESSLLVLFASAIGLIVVGNIVYFKGLYSFEPSILKTLFWPVNNPAAHFIIVTLITLAVLLTVVTIATAIPASRAAKMNPVDALHEE